MRELMLKYIDRVWNPGFEYEFETTQIDVHLLSDEELLNLFIDIARKY